MKQLHLFSNWRWTGPAEPAVNLCAALGRRGHDVTFACGTPPRGCRPEALRKARRRGLTVREGLTLYKHINPFHNYPDGRRLRQWLETDDYGLVHCHLRNAHIVAALAARRMERRPLLIRSSYAGEGPKGYWERRLIREFTDGLIVVSERGRDRAAQRLGFPAERVRVVHTAIDLERFDPDRGLGDLRARLGVPAEAFVVGIVARIQYRRRFDVLLEAVDRLRRELPGVKVLIVGRGTHMKAIAVDPVERMGLEETVIFPGYLTGDDYVRVMATMDVKVFLVPGTDGSCRAVREAMAMGVPVVAARRGMLPELVADGERGLVIDDSPENLAEALLSLARDPARRTAMGRAARAYAQGEFSLERQAETVGRFYDEVQALGQR
ncbi:MAG: glycosyltransferase family 4 protein [Planctomycetota bacterium]